MGACGVERTSQQRGGVEWYGEESPLGCLAGGQRVSSQWDDVLIRLESTSGEPTVSPVPPMGKFGGLLQEIIDLISTLELMAMCFIIMMMVN